MRVMKAALASIVAIALTVSVAWQEHAIARARLENRDRAAFLEQLRSAPDTRPAPAQEYTNEAWEQHAELVRLRTEAAALRSQLDQARAAHPAAAANGAGQLVPRPGFISAREARDVGSATAETMFQTFISAIGRGDTNRLIELADWSAEAGQKEAMMDSFVKASLEAASLPDLQFRVVREVALPDGDTAVVIEVSHGQALQRRALRARRLGAQWQLVVDRNGPQVVELGEDLKQD